MDNGNGDNELTLADAKDVLQCFSIALLGFMERGNVTPAMLDAALIDAFGTMMQATAGNELAAKRCLEANGVVMKLAALSNEVRMARAEKAN